MNFENKSAVVLVDTSYNSFYRLYATEFWFKLARKDDPKPETWLDNIHFMQKFDKMYLEGLMKVFKKRKLKIPFENVIFALDGPRSKIWRTAHYEIYKKQRDKIYKSKEWMGGPVLKHAHKILLPKLQQQYKFQTMKISTLEADDLIAITKKLY